ncbi:MAG TPA: hypothetical protein PLI34_13600 [Saprospiraceae bacterium]|nr:hypothetical protein [Saprospiraceae bacterium]
MKNQSFFIFALLAFILLSACKTSENNRESVLDAKRMEVEALVAKYSSENLAGPVNWQQFNAALKDEAVLEQMNTAQLEACLKSMTAYSNNIILENRKNGCDQLQEKIKSYTGQELKEFLEANKDLRASCDSLNKAYSSGFQKALEPCKGVLGASVERNK